MKFRKLIAGLTAAALLAGCSSNTAAASTAASTATPGTAATAAATPTADLEPGTAQAGAVTLNVSEVDMSGYEWLTDTNPPFKEITLAESIRMFTEGGTGVLYYGKTGCPWCQRAIPVLDAAAAQAGFTVYYIDVSKSVSEEDYNELCTYLNEIFEKDSEGNPEFQVPEVIAIKDGKITGHHLSLVESFSIDDTGVNQMDNDQTKELLDIYLELFKTLE